MLPIHSKYYCVDLVKFCFVFVHSITESEIAPLKSQLEELDTEITEMVRHFPIYIFSFVA